ncbi:MAG TPA: hypothetical protein V6D03_07465 [Candidatus Caenarcaniphilales bacterium]
MVERPIKKSERQAVAEPVQVASAALETETNVADGDPGSSTLATEERRTILPPVKGKDKSKGKGKQRQQQDERPKALANPALMRGPKPTKPKPPVLQEAEAADEDADEDTDTETKSEAISED